MVRDSELTPNNNLYVDRLWRALEASQSVSQAKQRQLDLKLGLALSLTGINVTDQDIIADRFEENFKTQRVETRVKDYYTRLILTTIPNLVTINSDPEYVATRLKELIDIGESEDNRASLYRKANYIVANINKESAQAKALAVSHLDTINSGERQTIAIPKKFLEKRTSALRMIQAIPPEKIDPASIVSPDGETITIDGKSYPTIKFKKDAKVGESELQGTGRMVFDAGTEVIKVDRYPMSYSGGATEALVWSKALENPWLKEQLLPLRRWGFIKKSDGQEGIEKWHIYTVFPKVTNFYPDNIDLRTEWDTQVEVANLGGGVIIDGGGSNVAKFKNKWVICDFNAPHNALIFGGPEYIELLQEYALNIRESAAAKIDTERSEGLERRRKVLEEAIDIVKDKYQSKDLFGE